MVYGAKTEYDEIVKRLKENTFLSSVRNNKLLMLFLEAKLNGGFERIVYDKLIVKKTAIKKARNIAKIDDYFKKDFDKLPEKELLNFRDLLNNDEIKCCKTLIEWKQEGNRKTPHYKIIKTGKPLSYRTKKDYVSNFKEFLEFIREYCLKIEGKELKDITKFFKIRQPTDYQEVKVNFIPKQELYTLLNNIKNQHFKALVQLNIMSGARPCEILNIKYGQGYNLYKNTEGKWIIHLPKMKGVSGTKFPFVIDMYEEELYPYFDNLKLKSGDKVFTTTNDSFRSLMKHYSTKYIGKNYTPKILRKTARMMRTNAGNSEQWINKLMGHSPNSNVQAHYVNYKGIETDETAREKLKEQQYPTLKQDYESLKLELNALKERQLEMEGIKFIWNTYHEGITNQEMKEFIEGKRREKGLPSWDEEARRFLAIFKS